MLTSTLRAVSYKFGLPWESSWETGLCRLRSLSLIASLSPATARQISGSSSDAQKAWMEDVPSVIDISTVAFAVGTRVAHPVEINVLSTPAREAARFLFRRQRGAPPLRELKAEGTRRIWERLSYSHGCTAKDRAFVSVR